MEVKAMKENVTLLENIVKKFDMFARLEHYERICIVGCVLDILIREIDDVSEREEVLVKVIRNLTAENMQ